MNSKELGQHRATAILKVREENGFITEDDLRQFLQGTYSTIRTLLDEEKVSLDTPPQLLQALKKERDDRMDKMSSDFKEQMKASREHYELMQTQFEENLRKTYEEKLLKINENAVGNLAPHGVLLTLS